jgi:hypothetical protein
VALKELVDEIVRMPVSNPDNGFSNRDHDGVLYVPHFR